MYHRLQNNFSGWLDNCPTKTLFVWSSARSLLYLNGLAYLKKQVLNWSCFYSHALWWARYKNEDLASLTFSTILNKLLHFPTIRISYRIFYYFNLFGNNLVQISLKLSHIIEEKIPFSEIISIPHSAFTSNLTMLYVRLRIAHSIKTMMFPFPNGIHCCSAIPFPLCMYMRPINMLGVSYWCVNNQS